jgi:hypothetical protein
MEGMMTQSEQINELVKALAEAQLEFEPVHKDSDNPYYSSKYADLATVIKATQPALAKRGLVVLQWPMNDAQLEEAGVISELCHSSGQWKRTELFLPATGKEKGGGAKYDAQTVSAAITYARRISYQAIVGVAAELDDDANSIGEPAGTGSRQAAQAVGQRKIAEYKAKGAVSSASSAKTAQSSNGQENVVLQPFGAGFMAISGKGLSIVKSEMTKADRDFFGIKLNPRGVPYLQAALSFKFQDLCARCKVGCIIMDAPKEERPNPGLPKAEIPPFNPDAEPESDSDDPILITAKVIEKEGKKPFMSLDWNGLKNFSTFDKSLWPILLAAVGKPVALETKANGKYWNLVRILRVAGVSFADEQNQGHADSSPGSPKLN